MCLSKLGVVSLLSANRTWGQIRKPKNLAGPVRMSVVIPCYNYGRFLPECVCSILNDQPGIDVEIIIVDDKSTDDSLSIARLIERRHPQVQVIANQANLGHIATYNRGLDAATSPYVLLISADDLVTPRALTRAAELMEAEPTVGLVYGRAIQFCGTPPSPRVMPGPWIVWRGADWLRHRCLSGYNVIASPEVVMRTSVLRTIGGYRDDLPLTGDFEMWMRASTVSDIAYLTGADQALRRNHSGNMNTTVFHTGSARGQLLDLQQRWQSFVAVFEGVGRELARSSDLYEIARTTMTRHALEHANYAYARGFRHYPVADFEAFARELDPKYLETPLGRGLRLRKRLGMLPLPIHPFWAVPAVSWRLKEMALRWRWDKVGV